MASKAWNSSLRLPGLLVESRTVVDGIVEMSGRLAAVRANCPDCAMPSTSLYSRYHRTLSDLPISGSTVRLRLSVRRFPCMHPPCPRRTFSEPLAPLVGRRYGRRLSRCDALVHAVAVARVVYGKFSCGVRYMRLDYAVRSDIAGQLCRAQHFSPAARRSASRLH